MIRARRHPGAGPNSLSVGMRGCAPSQVGRVRRAGGGSNTCARNTDTPQRSASELAAGTSSQMRLGDIRADERRFGR